MTENELGCPKADRTSERIRIDANILSSAAGGWFEPGAGKTEWFKEHEHGPEMVIVPAGSFMMGSLASEPEREPWENGTESPRHEVTFKEPFAVGRHAVTRWEFANFVDTTGYMPETGALVLKGDEWLHDPSALWSSPGAFKQDGTHPVVCISWDDAATYAAWLAKLTGQPYRLLTEAEWEYATRAGSTTPFWWGQAIAPAQANYNGDHVYAGGGSTGEFRKMTIPAASCDANPWGLFNVHGNVWEWCEDMWHNSYVGAPRDGSAWLQGGEPVHRVLRGGSWVNHPRFLRSAARFGYSADIRSYNFGFRLARSLAY